MRKVKVFWRTIALLLLFLVISQVLPIVGARQGTGRPANTSHTMDDDRNSNGHRGERDNKLGLRIDAERLGDGGLCPNEK